MPFLLQKIFFVVARTNWCHFLAILALHYFAFWGVVLAFEPFDNEIRTPIGFWYYYWVTAGTIGYGDIVPKADITRVLFPFFGMSGILLGMVILAKLSLIFAEMWSKYHKGGLTAMEEKPIIVIGYRQGTTERIILEHTRSNPNEKNGFIVCDETLTELPFDPRKLTDHSVQFVKGPVDADETFERANVRDAIFIYVCGQNDRDNLAIVSALSHFEPEAPVAVLLHDGKTRLPKNGMEVRPVPPSGAERAVRSMHDPCAATALAELLSASHGQNTYDISVPATYAEMPAPLFRQLFEKAFGAVMLSCNGIVVKPGSENSIKPGNTISYIHDKRLLESGWREFETLAAIHRIVSA